MEMAGRAKYLQAQMSRTDPRVGGNGFLSLLRPRARPSRHLGICKYADQHVSEIRDDSLLIHLGLPQSDPDRQDVHDDITQPDPPDRPTYDFPYPPGRVGEIILERRDKCDQQGEDAGEKGVVEPEP